jgi:hypothetical protein
MYSLKKSKKNTAAVNLKTHRIQGSQLRNNKLHGLITVQSAFTAQLLFEHLVIFILFSQTKLFQVKVQ